MAHYPRTAPYPKRSAKLRTSLLLRFPLYCCIGAVCATLTLACGPRNELIPKDDLQALLFDMYRISALVQTNDSLRRLYEEGKLDIYAQAAASHGYSVDQFDSTIMHYCRHAENLGDILNNVIAQLKKLEDTTNLLERKLALDSMKINTLIEIETDTLQLE